MMTTTYIPDLVINEEDAALYGVHMGEGFIETLTEPLSMKSYVENDSRLEHGKRIIVDTPRIDSREIVLEFVLLGDTPEQLKLRKAEFMKLMYEGEIELCVPQEDENTFYRLVYLGKGSEYGLTLSRTLCKLSLKFAEPNPTNRYGELYPWWKEPR